MEREVNQINVVPLVDVMLVLLGIVLTTATFVPTRQVPVNPAKAKETTARREVLIPVAPPAEEGLILNERPVAESGLAPLLQFYEKIGRL